MGHNFFEAQVISKNSHTQDDDDWDRFLVTTPHGYHEQASVYLENRLSFGFHRAPVISRDAQGKILGGAQLLYQRTPIGRLATLRCGPLAADDNPELLARVVQDIDRAAQNYRLASIKVETLPTQSAAREALANAGYQTGESWEYDRRSAFVDLSLSDEGILAGMDAKARSRIRGATRKGVTVTVGGPDDVATFYRLHQQTSGYQQFPTFPLDFFETLTGGFGAEKAPVFVAMHEDQPVAAIICVLAGGRMYYCWGGMDRSPHVKELNANRLLHFEAMRWGKAQGATGYDLTGTNIFKDQFAHSKPAWPQAQRKLFGAFSPIRRRLIDTCGTSERLKQLTYRLSWRFGYTQRMPF